MFGCGGRGGSAPELVMAADCLFNDRGGLSLVVPVVR